jgi:hypothetical protein
MEEKDVTITPEDRKRLASFAAIVPDERFDYVPIAFRKLPKVEQPIFKLKAMSGPEALEAEDMLHGESTVHKNGSVSLLTQRGRFALFVCNSRVVGWENYKTSKGRAIAFDETLKCLPNALLYELCNAITEYRGLTEEELQSLR